MSPAPSNPLKFLAVIDPALCNGCVLCVVACGPRCLELSNGVARLARPDACGSEAHCLTVCDRGAIRMRWQPFGGDRNVGLWKDS